MRRVECVDERCQERGVGRTGRRGDSHLHRLAGIADISFACDADPPGINAVAFETVHGIAFQGCVERGHCREVDRILLHHLGDDAIGSPIDRKQPEGGQIAGIARNDACLHPEQLHDRWRLRRTGAAEGEQREGARVDAALDRHLANCVGLIPVGDLDDAMGELLHGHRAGKPRGQGGEPCARTRDVERDAPADERARNASEDEVRIGDGGLGAAVRIAHGSGLGARAFRPDLEVPFAADPRD